MCTVRATHSNTAAAAVVHSRPPVAHPAVLRRVSRGACARMHTYVTRRGGSLTRDTGRACTKGWTGWWRKWRKRNGREGGEEGECRIQVNHHMYQLLLLLDFLHCCSQAIYARELFSAVAHHCRTSALLRTTVAHQLLRTTVAHLCCCAPLSHISAVAHHCRTSALTFTNAFLQCCTPRGGRGRWDSGLAGPTLISVNFIEIY